MSRETVRRSVHSSCTEWMFTIFFFGWCLLICLFCMYESAGESIQSGLGN
jgi:hypothetical protein